MPRWAVVLLTLVLYSASMAVVGVVVNATVPGVSAWLGANLGEVGATALVFGVIAIAGVYGYWPRDKAGRARRLRSPWD